jgi:Ni/Co efflux regulator RcnB
MRIVLSLLVAAALTAPMPTLAGNKGKKAHDAPATQTHSSEAVVALITVTERSIIFDYVNQYRDTLVAAPERAKPLPPGIAKKVARGGTLPPGIAKRYLPQNLLVQLPPRPGYQWVVVDNDVVLVVAATGLIADILADVL